MNVNFWARNADEELYDTVYFLGIPFTRTKGEVNGKKAYHYDTSEYQLTIVGRQIKINSEMFSSVAMAKKRLQQYAQ